MPFMITMVGYKHDADVSFDAESLYTGDMSKYLYMPFILIL